MLKTVVDDDECEKDPCTLDVCENTVGSYKCKCNVGFVERENKCSRKWQCFYCISGN